MTLQLICAIQSGTDITVNIYTRTIASHDILSRGGGLKHYLQTETDKALNLSTKKCVYRQKRFFSKSSLSLWGGLMQNTAISTLFDYVMIKHAFIYRRKSLNLKLLTRSPNVGRCYTPTPPASYTPGPTRSCTFS